MAPSAASTIDVSGEAAISPACARLLTARAFAISSHFARARKPMSAARRQTLLASFNAIAPPFTISVTDR